MNSIKNSQVSGQVPAVSQIGVGDIAVNNADGALYILKTTPGAATTVVQIAGLTSFNLRTGAVTLNSGDVIAAMGYTPVNPAAAALTGSPTAPTATAGSNTTQIATTAFVSSAIANIHVASATTTLDALTDVLVAEGASIDGYFLAFSSSQSKWVAEQLSVVAKTGSYADLLNTPALSPVATSGSYTDLMNKPAAFVLTPATTSLLGGVKAGNGLTVAADGTLSASIITSLAGLSDVSVTEGATIDNNALVYNNATSKWKASALSAVAFSGKYSDLTGTPQAGGVISFNSRTGAVTLTSSDVTTALGFTPANTTSLSSYATLASPTFTGNPTAPTPAVGDNDTSIATTAFVTAAVTAAAPDLSGYAPLASPALTGVPTGPTAAPGTSTTQLATTAFVTASAPNLSGYAPLASPALTGTPTAPTATAGNSTTQVATTAFVSAAVTASAPNLSGYAPLASPALTGVPTGPTATSGTNTTQLATTAFVASAVTASAPNLSGYAPLASPALTGTPSAPTATAGTNTTQVATTAFVASAVTAAAPNLSGYAPLASPALTGTPTAPTATAGTSTTQLATTAFVASAVNSGVSGSVVSFNTRTGAVTLTAADVTGVGGALLASPALTGTPTAPTAAQGTNTTQLATTAFVQAAKYYDVVGGAIGPVIASQLMVQFVSGRTVTFPAGLTNSQGYALTAPTASATFTITANGTAVGTMVFAAGSHTATFTASSSFGLTAGQILTITAPSSADTTMATVSFTLLGLAT